MTNKKKNDDDLEKQFIPRYHLFTKYPNEDEGFWGWDDHLGAHTHLQHLLDHTKTLPEGTQWHVVDLFKQTVIARSLDMERLLKH